MTTPYVLTIYTVFCVTVWYGRHDGDGISLSWYGVSSSIHCREQFELAPFGGMHSKTGFLNVTYDRGVPTKRKDLKSGISRGNFLAKLSRIPPKLMLQGGVGARDY